MQLVRAGIEFKNAWAPLTLVEHAGRKAYQSDSAFTKESSEAFVRMIMSKTPKHTSVIEHCGATFDIVCDRGVSHEIVRHRLMSPTQESTRYVNYTKKGIKFIIPLWMSVQPGTYTLNDDFSHLPDNEAIWMIAMLRAEEYYNQLIAGGWKPQQARAVLPNSLKTELTITANLTEWHHIMVMRTAQDAHPQMREIAIPIYDKLMELYAPVFEDIVVER